MFTKRDAHVRVTRGRVGEPSPRNLSPRSRRRWEGSAPPRATRQSIPARRPQSNPIRVFHAEHCQRNRAQFFAIQTSQSVPASKVFPPRVRQQQLRRRHGRNGVNYCRVASDLTGLLLFWMKLCHFSENSCLSAVVPTRPTR